MDVKSKRIVKNTLYLYVQMAIFMAISIYTSRVLLDKLGINDFGIYNVVGGVVVLFSFFSSPLRYASQRFLTVELGRRDLKKANVVFNQHLLVYSLIAGGVLLIAETLGLWFVYTQLVIPPDRLFAAVCVYHFSVVSLCISLLGIVFNASIVAHEDMGVFSFFGIFQAVAKLAIVYMLIVSSADRLIAYGFLMLMVTLIIQVAYVIYCYGHYEECKFRRVWDKEVLKESATMVGWSMVGTGVSVMNDSGVNVLMNIFFGPTVNAARALSTQINGTVGNLAGHFYTSVQPALTKAHASGDEDYMMKLFYNSSKYSFYLTWIIFLPIVFCMDELLAIWLVEVPDFVASFTIWIFLGSLVSTLVSPVWTLILAVGKLKGYILIGCSILLFIFPLSYLALKLGYSPVSVFMVMLAIRSVHLVVILCILSAYIPLTVGGYLHAVVYPILGTVGVSLVMVLGFLYSIYPIDTTIGTLSYCVTAALITIICIFLVGITKKEQSFMLNVIKNKLFIRKSR